jgi:hypothetical protein
MHIKTLVNFRSKSPPLHEMVAAASQIPDPQTVWEPSVVTEAKIQALVDRRLSRPKAKV